MAKILKQLVFGQKKNPPAPPRPDYQGEGPPKDEFADHDYENIPRFSSEGGTRVQFQEKKEPELLVFENYSEPADLLRSLAAASDEEEEVYMAPVDDASHHLPSAPPLEEDMYCVPYEEETTPPVPEPCLTTGFLIQKLGRKTVLMCVSVTYTMSWLIIAYSDTVPTIYVGRVLGGLCAGITCVAAPAYVAEIAPPAYRGRLSSGFQLAFATGVLLAMSLGAVLRWSWLAVAGAMFVVAASIALFPMPESPPWLLRRSLTQEARRAVKFLRGPDIDLNKEIKDIADNCPKDQAGLGLDDFRDPAFYKPVLISFSLMFFQQFSGINPLMAYTVEIFQGTGGSIPPEVAAVVVAVVQLAATVVSTALVDRSGRRKLLILSSSFMTVFLVTLGLYSYAPNTTFSWVPLFSFVGYIVSYSLGVGPIPFVLTPELANIRTRGAVIAAASVSCSLFGFVVTKVYEDMKRTLGLYGVYWTYGFFTLCCAVFTYFFVPETKGMSIRQIHRSFSAPHGSS